jgi:hypothetical protein
MPARLSRGPLILDWFAFVSRKKAEIRKFEERTKRK